MTRWLVSMGQADTTQCGKSIREDPEPVSHEGTGFTDVPLLASLGHTERRVGSLRGGAHLT